MDLAQLSVFADAVKLAEPSCILLAAIFSLDVAANPRPALGRAGVVRFDPHRLAPTAGPVALVPTAGDLPRGLASFGLAPAQAVPEVNGRGPARVAESAAANPPKP